MVTQVDKIYLSTPTKIAILDHEKKRTFVIRKDGLPDAGETNFICLLLLAMFLVIYGGFYLISMYLAMLAGRSIFFSGKNAIK